MRAPDFWQRPPGALAHLLAPLGALYAAGGRLRWKLAATHRASVPVICIGNVTTGGTGKTPLAIAVAGRLRAMGLSPAFLSRGHGGRLRGPVRVDPARMDAGDVGDEPPLLARHAPAFVARDRRQGADAAAAAGADVLIMDDGYQNPGLYKDVGLLVVDAQAGLGNGRVLPAGPLREPVAAALGRATAVVLMGDGAAGAQVAELAAARGLPVLRARLQPLAEDIAALRGAPLLAFAGIGRPEKFRATLEASGCTVAQMRGFPDHHRYSAPEAAALLEAARKAGLTPVTTEKDLARMAGAEGPVAALRDAARVVRVEAIIEDGPALDRLLAGRLREARTQGAYRAF